MAGSTYHDMSIATKKRKQAPIEVVRDKDNHDRYHAVCEGEVLKSGSSKKTIDNWVWGKLYQYFLYTLPPTMDAKQRQAARWEEYQRTHEEFRGGTNR